jgi:endonuclease IV
MRFGIMAMQIDYLLPKELRGLPVEQALTTVMSFSQVNLANELAQHGFKLIEIGGDLATLLPHTFQEDAILELADLKKDIDLEFTMHLPLWSVEPSTLLEPVRNGSVEALVDIVKSTRHLEPEVYVLHATGALAAEFYHMNLPETARAVLMRQFQNNARQSLQTILQKTGLSSRQIAIETIEFPFDLTLELAEDLDLSICFDTGHVLAGFSGPIGIFEALRCLGMTAHGRG